MVHAASSGPAKAAWQTLLSRLAGAPGPVIRRARTRSLGLAGRGAFWTIVFGVIVTAFISIYMYAGAVRMLTEIELQTTTDAVETASDRLADSLDLMLGDVTFLAGTPPAQGLVKGSTYWREPIEVSTGFWRDRLAELFASLMKARPQYVQARLIGLADGGREIVRVDRKPDGTIERTRENELQRKGERPYLQQALQVGPGRVHISRIELNQEHGRVQVPHLPVIRIATPVFDTAGAPFGIVIVNVDADWLLRRATNNTSAGQIWYVANSQGDYLYSPDPARNFGFNLGRRFLIQDDFPAFAALIDSDETRFSDTISAGSESYLASARKVVLDPAQPQRFVIVAGLAPIAPLLAEINGQRRNILIIALALVLCGSAFAVILARTVARPLKQVTAAATRLAGGEHDIDLTRLTRRRDETGELARAFSAMASEIAEREERLIAQTRELERSNQELAQFAYVASHDLQEPLRMIGSYLELLEHRHGDAFDGEAREFIDFAIDGAARMKQLINDLLNYSRAGYRELKCETVDLQEVVDNVLRVLDRQIREAGAKIEIGNLPAVTADAGEIGRVFMNLIENALKYRSEQTPHIRIGAERVDGGWRLSVADNGIGIEPRFHDKVFEIFRRLHDREKYSGTGIGLAVVKVTVERHGGAVGVESEPGRGSTFTFTLPDR